ncbi:hypothetical protein GIB67_008143 [Kingdonia uniflora]|uniref:Uncharacterized protein n=1 Tax=Kingdonia uniflora TaxID=39325 RepID=A0A7J7MT49_9MAGN|nr:hypothetical protein GIB67_008143 [Kingdonia uniflora]
MAEYATVPSCSKLPLQKSFYKLSSFIPILHSCRKLSYGKFSVITRLSSRKNYVFSVPTAPLLRRPMSIKESFSSCCLGTLMDLENVTPSNWTPVVDDLLLTIGVFLTYMAGIIPSQKAYSSSRQNVSNYDAVTANLTSLGSDMNSEFNPVYVWDEVRRKLMIALNAVIQDDNLNSKVDQREKSSEKLPFSLYAIAEIPRLRLLQATLQQLEKEVSNISESYETVNKDNQSGLVLEIVKKCGKSVCLAWLEEELYLESRKHDKALLSTTFRKLKDEDTILQNIKKSSKDDIYEDLLFYLRFGSIRLGSVDVEYFKFLVKTWLEIDWMHNSNRPGICKSGPCYSFQLFCSPPGS